MEELLFIEKNVVPNENLVIEALKDSFSLYCKIYEEIEAMRPNIQTEWKYYGKKNGWLMKHLDAKRNLFFLVIYDGYFKLSITFGDKAILQILSSDNVSIDIKKQIEKLKRYSEGTTILLPIISTSDVEQAIELLKYKLC